MACISWMRLRIEGHHWSGGKNLQSKTYCEPIPLSVDLHSEVGEFPPVHRIKVAVASSVDVELRVGLLAMGFLLGAIATKQTVPNCWTQLVPAMFQSELFQGRCYRTISL
jgi:hypothetical protein